MRSSCKTNDEFKISKALLTANLSSPDFLVQHANKCAAERIHAFIQKTSWATGILHLLLPMAPCLQERTNNGLKTAVAPVLPQHSLDCSASIINQNAQIKAALNGILFATAVSTNVLWSKLPTSQKLTKKGEGLVIRQWELWNNCIAQRVAENGWRVVGIVYRDHKITGGLIPQFTLFQEVSIVDNRILLCSCDYVYQKGGNSLLTPDAYFVLCGSKIHGHQSPWCCREDLVESFSHQPAYQQIAGLYTSLCREDIKSPTLPNSAILPPVISTITDPFVIKLPKETCHNYDILLKHHMCRAAAPFHGGWHWQWRFRWQQQWGTLQHTARDNYLQQQWQSDNWLSGSWFCKLQKCPYSIQCYCAPCKTACIPSRRQLFHGQTGTNTRKCSRTESWKRITK